METYFDMSVSVFETVAKDTLMQVIKTGNRRYSLVSAGEREQVVEFLVERYKISQKIKDVDQRPLYLMISVRERLCRQHLKINGWMKKVNDSKELEEHILSTQKIVKLSYLECSCIMKWKNHMNGKVLEQIHDIHKICLVQCEELISRMEEMKEKAAELERIPKLPFPVKLKRYLDEWVVGQDVLKERLALKVHHYVTYGDRSPFLIIGPSGCGKNHTIDCLKNHPDIQENMLVMSYDVSQITQNGFKGNDISDIMSRFQMMAQAKGLPLDKGIIYLDEFDKIIMPNTSSTGENVNAHIQLQLLSMIAGTEIFEQVNTGNLLFVLGGAFTFLDSIRETQGKKHSIGFTLGQSKGLLSQMNTSLRDDLLAAGAQREMLGRISEIVQMERLNANQLKEILINKRFGVLEKMKKIYEQDGVILEVEDSVVDAIVQKAVEEDLGARSVTNIVYDLFGGYLFTCIEQESPSVLFHKGMLMGNQPPQFGNKAKCHT